MKIKTGDNVKVMSGKDKGKTGKITQIFPGLGRVVIEGVNKRIKHLRPQKRGEKGEKIEFFAPIAASSVRLVCPKCEKSIRTSVQFVETPAGKTKKMRVCKKCKETIE